MKPYRFLLSLIGLFCAVLAGHAAAQTVAPTRADNDVNTRKGFEDFYNLEYDRALREFEAAQQAHPNDPFATNHVLSGVIFKELYRIGALDTEAYAADSFLRRQSANYHRRPAFQHHDHRQ